MAKPVVPATLGEALRALGEQIDRLDARLLVQHVVGCTHADLIARPERPVETEQWLRLDELAKRRQAGEPLAYLLGQAEFCGLTLSVTPAVLVPRPETELLVERVLAVLQKKGPTATVLDLGTGSGAIPLAIKAARPAWRVLGVDVSRQALDVARTNGFRLGLAVEWLESDWTGNLPADLRVDAIVANPPYIAAGDPHLSGDGVRFEPALALTDFGDGLSALQRIIGQAPRFLPAGGYVLLEHGYDQAAAVREALMADFEAVESWADLAGIERVSGGRRKALR